MTNDPVFVDRTGQRRRLFVAAGTAGGCLLVLAVAALLAAFTGVSPGANPGWPAATTRPAGPALAGSPEASAPTAEDHAAVPQPTAGSTTTPAPAATTATATPAATATSRSNGRAPTTKPTAVSTRPSKRN